MINVDFVEVYVMTIKPNSELMKKIQGEDEEDNYDSIDWEGMGLPAPNRNKVTDYKELLTKNNIVWRKRLIRPDLIIALSETFIDTLNCSAVECWMDDGEIIMLAGNVELFENLLQVNKVVIRPENN